MIALVDVDQRVLVDPGHQRRGSGEPAQEPGSDRVELADVAEGERPQERASVEGAYAPVKTLPIAPWRRTGMSSMLSAPSTIPATSEETFKPAFAPLSVGTLRC